MKCLLGNLTREVRINNLIYANTTNNLQSGPNNESKMTDTIKDYCHRLVVKDYNILKIVFTILTSYLIFDTFYTWLVRQPTYTSLEKRPITGDDFPDIMICPQPSVDKEVYNLRAILELTPISKATHPGQEKNQ